MNHFPLQGQTVSFRAFLHYLSLSGRHRRKYSPLCINDSPEGPVLMAFWRCCCLSRVVGGGKWENVIRPDIYRKLISFLSKWLLLLWSPHALRNTDKDQGEFYDQRNVTQGMAWVVSSGTPSKHDCLMSKTSDALFKFPLFTPILLLRKAFFL